MIQKVRCLVFKPVGETLESSSQITCQFLRWGGPVSSLDRVGVKTVVPSLVTNKHHFVSFFSIDCLVREGIITPDGVLKHVVMEVWKFLLHAAIGGQAKDQNSL